MKRNIFEQVILIGASTGGVEALCSLLDGFPEDCPPTFVVQHTGAAFGHSLVKLLDANCRASVVEARNGLAVGIGTVCVAAGTLAHLKVSNSNPIRAQLVNGGSVSGHMPSVNVMFESALPMARRSIACLLTGMGDDGARGLLKLRNGGARTFCQNEESSVVYGMPRVAWELGAAERQLDIRDMARAIFGSLSSIPNTEAGM